MLLTRPSARPKSGSVYSPTPTWWVHVRDLGIGTGRFRYSLGASINSSVDYNSLIHYTTGV